MESKFNHSYNTERLPLCSSIPGYIRGRRFEAVMGEPKYITVHEMQSAQVAESSEWEEWRTAITPDWSNIVRPQMTHETGSPGIYARRD